MKSLGFEQGHSLDDYLTKYRYQRDGGRSRDAEIYAEDFNDITFLKELTSLTFRKRCGAR